MDAKDVTAIIETLRGQGDEVRSDQVSLNDVDLNGVDLQAANLSGFDLRGASSQPHHLPAKIGSDRNYVAAGPRPR